jgi:hypothetical protein
MRHGRFAFYPLNELFEILKLWNAARAFSSVMGFISVLLLGFPGQ